MLAVVQRFFSLLFVYIFSVYFAVSNKDATKSSFKFLDVSSVLFFMYYCIPHLNILVGGYYGSVFITMHLQNLVVHAISNVGALRAPKNKFLS